MALQSAAEDEVPQDAVGIPRQLDHPHRHSGLVVERRPGTGVAAVMVDRHLQLFAHRPDGFVVGGVERGQVAVGRHARHEDAAGEARLLGPAHFGDGGVDVVEEDLGHARPPAGRLGAEVGHPAVVGLEAGPPQLELLGRGRR